MERYMELESRAHAIKDEIRRLQDELNKINLEWSVESLSELGVSKGQKVSSGGSDFIVESRYGTATLGSKWLVGRKIRKNGNLFAITSTIYRWDK